MQELRNRIVREVGKATVGLDAVVERLVIALAVGGHVLLEGVPGVAKTLVANATARSLGLDFRRAQFTPDMLPSDLTGTMALRGQELVFRPGPVFTSVLLADEINRTPPKTQAALLEAMQERQVTVDGESRPLPDPFVVVATQNPIEYEGTYPLPEAQLDRFLFRVDVGYPDAASERAILESSRRGVTATGIETIASVVGVAEIREAAAAVDATTVAGEVLDYIVGVVRATRSLPAVEVGASPRASVHLLVAAKAAARLHGRSYVTPDDVVAVVGDVLAHRIVLRPEAELDGVAPRDAIETALRTVHVPR